MMNLKSLALCLVVLWESRILQHKHAIFLVDAQVTCGPSGGSFSIAGSSTVEPIANAWATGYRAACPGINVTVVTGGGSSDGAARVCGDTTAGTPVDIGTMSRAWETTEAAAASTTEPYVYDCVAGDDTRSAIQVEVGIDGLTVAMLDGGAGSACVKAMGGLTIDQLRWIYSSLTVAELEAAEGGWTAATSLPGSDGDDATHLWSELSTSADCPDTEIKIAGADEASGTYDYFSETVFSGTSETFDSDRPDGYAGSAVDAATVTDILADEAMIGYFGYAYYSLNSASLYAAPIRNSADVYVLPNTTTIASGAYEPLSRRLYMNLLQTDASLANTAPFIVYGLSDAGSDLVLGTGYSTIPESERAGMISRTETSTTPAAVPTGGSSTGAASTFDQCGPSGGSFTIAGSSTVQPLAEAWARAYEDACQVTITVTGGGSDVGASRLCAVSGAGDPIEIGDMSRQWEDAEATSGSSTPWQYQCAVGETSRMAIQVEVAIDGLSITMRADGAGAACVQAMGGLTIDQLRWMYSSYTETQLTADGWSATALAASDGDDATHLWSELFTNAACPTEEIMIAGADSLSGTYDFFMETILTGSETGTETFATSRTYFNSANDADIVGYVLGNPAAIGFYGYAYYTQNATNLYVAPIESTPGSGNFVRPSSETVAEGTYTPLSRRLYMNLLTTATSFDDTAPFILFGMSTEGTALVESVGYEPIPADDRLQMIDRVSTDDAPAPAPNSAPAAPSGSGPASEACGPSGGSISIAGSSTVAPIANRWAAAYRSSCPGVTVTVEEGGSSSGADRLCSVSGAGSPVDIGDMSREWNEDEAVSSGVEYLFECVNGEPPNRAIQIDVGIDGLSVTMQAEGAGAACVASMGGLTLDQLRWIYSSYTVAELTGTGWNAAALANSDGSDATHLWSELSTSSDCPPEEILIAGADSASGTYEYFRDAVLSDHEAGETFAPSRPVAYFNNADDVAIVNYVTGDGSVIGYFGYAYLSQTGDSLYAAPIMNTAGNYIPPNPSTVSDGSYSPLSRRMYMNVLDSDESLPDTVPFIAFGMSDEGATLVAETGYSPIPTAERQEMLERLREAAPSVPIPAPTAVVLPEDGCGPAGATFTIAGSSTVVPLAEAWANAYESACSVTISVAGGGSTAGAEQVCAVDGAGSPVDIGNMSREWATEEASTRGSDHLYQCAIGDTSRAIIQVDVAIDGISVTMQEGGAAATCVQSLGGLTIDQLRWIFSSYTAAELQDSNWNAGALTNSDNDDTTHLWSELSSECPAEEIKIAGADSASGTYEYFRDNVLPAYDAGERFASTRPDPYYSSADDAELVGYVAGDSAAIGYFGFAYYNDNLDRLYAASIADANGVFVEPTPESIASGSYSPLSRRLYMNVLDNAASLANTAPFISFAMSESGTALVTRTGYSPLPETERNEMVNRVGGEIQDGSGSTSAAYDGSLAFGLLWLALNIVLAIV